MREVMKSVKAMQEVLRVGIPYWLIFASMLIVVDFTD